VSPRRDIEDEQRYHRPQRRTRPRTKDRPAHEEAVEGLVTTIDRGRYTLEVTDEDGEHPVTAMTARALGRKAVVVGDRVRVVGDVTGAEGTLARIVEVTERTTTLRRSADDDDSVERVIVANADQLVIVTSVANPEPRTGLIDRALVAAFTEGLAPVLCVTKLDLADPAELLDAYRPLGVKVLGVRRGADLTGLRDVLHDRVSVLVGHSGVGKSTVVNALVPGTDRATGVVNAITGRGRHTSTSALALRLPFGGWIVDTPGIRSFGLAHIEPNQLIAAFDDLEPLTDDCPRGCTHAASEPECALDDALAEDRVDPERVASFRRLLDSRTRPV